MYVYRPEGRLPREQRLLRKLLRTFLRRPHNSPDQLIEQMEWACDYLLNVKRRQERANGGGRKAA